MTKPFDKIAAFTDIHFGRNSNSEMANIDNLDFIQWFIDTAKENGITTAAFLGDYFDNRHSIHVSTLNYGLRGMEMLNDAFEKVYFIIGNHDLLYRDKRDVSSMAFAQHLPNIHLISESLTVGTGRDSITFLPWLVKNEKNTLRDIKSRYVFGHLELSGFLMNAKVAMPVHADGPDINDMTGPEFWFNGHFHFRQQRGNVIYIGNTFPFNFADAWDNERGMMMLEWGGQPVFEAWPDAPQYRTMTLSELLTRPDEMLCRKLTARVTLDIDISFEEAQLIRDEYIGRYDMRKIELIHQSTRHAVTEQTGELKFQSVNTTVIEGLMTVASDNYDKDRLIEMYRELDE